MATSEPTRSAYFEDLYRLISDREATLNEKIDRAIEIGRDRLNVENGVVTYTGDGEYEILDTNITTGKYTPGSVTDLETTWCRHVVEDREPLAFGDASRTAYEDDIAMEETGLHCYIGVPLIIDGETYGTLCYSSEAPQSEFTEEERQFVRLLAEWISYEIERSKHYRELRAQNERLDEFTGVIAHDLRNPLTGAMGYLELALDGASEEQREFLMVVDESLDRMESMISELLLLAKQGSDVGERTSVTLASVARDAWETVSTGDATIDIETDMTIYADETRLRQLLKNLFENAVEHSRSDVSVRVTEVEGGFAVADDGPGLPEDMADALFTTTRKSNIRLGFGLIVVERVVSGHDWHGSVETGEEGTRFVFTRVEVQS
ncbi:MAG: GAF domain-containing sensor histidine kinase [Halobacteriales archaeon]